MSDVPENPMHDDPDLPDPSPDHHHHHDGGHGDGHGDDPIDLDDDLDDDLDLDDLGDDLGDDPIDLDDDLDGGSGDVADDESGDDVAEAEDPADGLDHEATIRLDLEESQGFGQLDGLLSDVAIDADDFERTMDALGLADEPDGRSIVSTLEHLDVPARVEHQTVDRLADLLADGAEIRLASGHVVVALDDLTDEAVIRIDGETTRFALEELEQRWSLHGFEAIVAETDEGRIVLLPTSVAVDDADNDRVVQDGGLTG